MTALIHEALMSKKDDETSDSKIPRDLPDHKHFPKLKTHAIVKNMPAHLKDPANYDKIQKAILEAGATRHSHGEIEDWAKCTKCQMALANRSETMKKLGFQTGTHYIIWRRIHEQMKLIERDPLSKYNQL